MTTTAEETAVRDATTARERVYGELFGPCQAVRRGTPSPGPRIDVYIHPPVAERGFYTLVSGGLSDERMRVPKAARSSRAEVVLYVDEPAPEYIELVRTVASLPHRLGTWLGRGHTIGNGEPPQPLFEGSLLDAVVLLPSIVFPDDLLPERLEIEGDPVELLWIVPITSGELTLLREHGLEALADLLDEHDHPVTLDPDRPSYL